ncbi:MAG TPA: hypothetical protein PK723_02875 [Candidatus Pacearchaeota archaeon]|nr:hypothetical protein [Candidatus Pacearchaeota archaeon]
MAKLKINQEVLPRDGYENIGLIDFNGEDYITVVWNTQRLADEIIKNKLSPEAVEMLVRIFKTTDNVAVTVFSGDIKGEKQIREFLDKITEEHLCDDFLTILSTCKEVEEIGTIIDWATENRRIYLQTSTTEVNPFSEYYHYLLNLRQSPYDHIDAAVRIAIYFGNRFGNLKIDNLINAYRFNDGVSLTELLYHTLLEIELYRELLSAESLEEEYISAILDKTFDKAVKFLGKYFEKSADKIKTQVIDGRAHFYYYYDEEEFSIII